MSGMASGFFCRIDDCSEADLSPVMLQALPFMQQAISVGGRVLVHCEQGKSRSASVVVAYIMATVGIGREAALDLVQSRRPIAQPNEGFMEQLLHEKWLQTLELSTDTFPQAKRSRTMEPEPSSDDLTRWIKRSYALQLRSDGPEHEGLSTKDASWLSSNFDAEVVERRDLQGLGFELLNLFSRSECWNIIQETETLGYGRTAYPHAYRGNRRLQLDDAPGCLAQSIWHRIKAYLPSEIQLPNQEDSTDITTWRAVGCNTRFRFSKYYAGDQFGAHFDSEYISNDGLLSFFTVNAYLNDLGPEQKGRTRFYERRAGPVVASAGGRAGSAVIFRQGEALHDGEQLQCGLKYLLRTDVMYEQVT